MGKRVAQKRDTTLVAVIRLYRSDTLQAKTLRLLQRNKWAKGYPWEGTGCHSGDASQPNWCCPMREGVMWQKRERRWGK